MSANAINTVMIGGPEDEYLSFSPSPFALRVSWGTVEEPGPPRRAMRFVGDSDFAPAWVEDREADLRLWSPGLNLFVDLERRAGKARLSGTRGWQNLLRVIYFHALLEQGGLLLHASGLVRDGKAFVFPGLSGAGKTTLVRHSPGMTLLSDEMTAVRSPGEGEGALALGTPFFGELERPGETVTAPLTGFYFPCQASEDRLIPLDAPAVLSRLLPCICTFTTWQPRLQRVFDLAADLAERVPGYELHFRPSPNFWQVIDAT